MARVLKLLRRFRDGDAGQGLVEFSLIVALVAVGLVLVVITFRNSVGKTMANTTTSIQAAPGTAYWPGGRGSGNGRGGGTGGGQGSGRGGGTGGQGSGS